MRLGPLPEALRGAFGRDVLFRVVPSTTGVAHRNRKLHAGDQCARQQACACVLAEAKSCNKWAQDDQKPWCYHFPQGSICGDLDALLVVGLLALVEDQWELPDALLVEV